MDACRGRVEITRRGDDREGTAHQREPALEGQHEPRAGGGGRPPLRPRAWRPSLSGSATRKSAGASPAAFAARPARSAACSPRTAATSSSPRRAECDGFIVGSPVYYAGMAGSLRALMRPDVLRRRGELPLQARRRRRRGAPGRGHRRRPTRSTSTSRSTASPSSPAPTGTSPTDAPPARRKATARACTPCACSGRNMAWMLKCIEAGRAAGINAAGDGAQGDDQRGARGSARRIASRAAHDP